MIRLFEINPTFKTNFNLYSKLSAFYSEITGSNMNSSLQLTSSMIKSLLLFLFGAINHLHYSSRTGLTNKKIWYPDSTQSTLFSKILMTGNEYEYSIVFEWHMSTRAVLFSRQIKVSAFPALTASNGHWFVRDQIMCARSIIKVFALLSKQFNRHQCMQTIRSETV